MSVICVQSGKAVALEPCLWEHSPGLQSQSYLTHFGLSQIFEQNMKVDGFQRLIRQNVRGRSLFQKALLCFCVSASLQAVKAIPTIGDFESVSGRRWERVKRRRSRKGCFLEARYIAQWNSGENLICLHVRTPSLALILREIGDAQLALSRAHSHPQTWNCDMRKGPDMRFSKSADLPVNQNADTSCTPSWC